MLKAILFDLDGTLLDRETSLKQFIGTQYDRLIWGLHEIPKEDYISRFIELDCRGYVWKDKVYQSLISEFSIKKLSWQDLLNDYENQFIHSCVPFPHLKTTLETLKTSGYLLGIITNGLEIFQHRTIQGLGIENYFDVIIISESEGVRKPEAEIFDRALQKLRVKAQQSVFVGDHPTIDVLGAKSFGMKAVWKRDPYWTEPIEADAIIDDLSLLPSIIQSFNHSIN
ncbi:MULTISPECIES: HAD family hydrolase [Fischerella]|uniref:HAD family hydrolase n=1 Tax=Fischerella muscicola CCMEE 5323 TaxID=2019572 RepID=A0A2N6K088_FISMU|nr:MULTISPECIES: HAD family hydrolase [Fischerella]MBD2434684.1 HAD family hydrolase [Fischerella sp. FACHB-380]PLZ87368.1 HAD family hydrolase [Fischerella muscicola CCMEE 5323]PMB45788.1 HAD family hydrolase [Fischerella thermalis CCMEE 5201]